MDISARTFGLTFAASLGLHGLLLLAAAALMTVMPAFPRDGRREVTVPNETVVDDGELPPELAEVEISFLDLEQIPRQEKPREELPKPSPAPPSGEKMVYAPEDRPALAPLNPETPFISSQNMRAASSGAPTPGANPNLISQDGQELPVLSLTSSAFVEGSLTPNAAATPVPPTPPQETPPPPDPVPDPVKDIPKESAPAPPTEQRPPEPQATVQTSDPLAPAAPDKSAARTTPVPEQDTPPPAPTLREPQVEPVAENKIKPPPKRPRDPVVARNDQSKSGQRGSLSSLKTKSVGAVTQRGDGSVDARDTPEGRYGKAVHDIINPIWNRKLSAVRALTGVGVVEVSFEIDIRGAVSNVRLVDPGKANPVFEDVCLASIIQAKLPPPPAGMQVEMRDPLSNGKLSRSISFFKQY